MRQKSKQHRSLLGQGHLPFTEEENSEKYDWEVHARANQRLPEDNWQVWLILAGRGFGKTRTGAETIRQWVREGKCRRLAFVAESERDARQVMVEGLSGILEISPSEERPEFFPSRGELLWPNGAVGILFSAEAPERLRGPQFDGAWVDEFAKFSRAEYVWDQLMFCLRLGKNPQVIITTTPRPLKILESIMEGKQTFLTQGSSYENIKNLAPTFVDQVLEKYKNTRLGRQEIYAHLLMEKGGALWHRSLIQYGRP